MKLEVKFSESKQSFAPQFGEVHNITDGGFERGYAAGKVDGYDDGYTDGAADGYATGYDRGVAAVPSVCLVRKGIGSIDTGVDGANSNLTIEARYEFITLPTGYFNLVYAYLNEQTNATRICFNKNISTLACLNSIPTQSLSQTATRRESVVYTDTLKPVGGTSFSYASDGVTTNKNRVNGSSLEGKTLSIFTKSSSNDRVDIKMYYLKIYDGETLIRDYVPYATADGECGMYDNVTQQFYGNAGDGTFEVERQSIVQG